KAQFYIGLFVLLPITAYLIVFYMSASYSAFFKEFSTDELTAAIFDAQTYSKALNEGVMELIFVCTIPFAFMGLGYLIHMFQKNKATLKIIGLFLITFLFDAILAYQIEMKVYDFNRTLNSPDFNIQYAFQSVAFWGIIFAGFVVYIIWGLVFDFIMKEYDNLDRVQQYVKKLKEDKSHRIKRLEEIKVSTDAVTEEIAGLRGKARELQAKIDGFIFPKQKYLVLHARYAKGWIKAILKEIALPANEKDRLIHACQKVEKAHLTKYGLGVGNAESILFYTNPDTDD
ncbi:MAG: ABC transporter permease, partial [Owenweeksia sp.]